jgi:small subunit ribosomal protein S8
MSDQIADMLTIIRNALAVKKPFAVVPFSKLKMELAKLLLKNGFIEKVDTEGRKVKKEIKIYLKYNEDRVPAISGLKRISKPGQRIYKKYKELRPVKFGYGIAVISTSKGLLTDKEARKQKLGGELICEVW